MQYVYPSKRLYHWSCQESYCLQSEPRGTACRCLSLLSSWCSEVWLRHTFAFFCLCKWAPVETGPPCFIVLIILAVLVRKSKLQQVAVTIRDEERSEHNCKALWLPRPTIRAPRKGEGGVPIVPLSTLYYGFCASLLCRLLWGPWKESRKWVKNFLFAKSESIKYSCTGTGRRTRICCEIRLSDSN